MEKIIERGKGFILKILTFISTRPKKRFKMKALDIANKIVNSIDTEKGDTISNLKLQKLLYYMQGFHIAIFDTPLFEEKVVAWNYGPVVREVYHHFSKFQSGHIVLDADTEIISLNPNQEDLFNQVMKEYGQYSAIKLMDMTHEENPWKSVFFSNPNGEITVELLKEYFISQVE